VVILHALVAAVMAVGATAAVAATCPVNADYGSAGPYGIGVRTLTLVDETRRTPAHADVAELPQRTLVTEVWYPTSSPGAEPQRDAPLAGGGPFPLIVNSPGLRDNRQGEAYYGRHLASRGFVVASVEFPLTNTFIPVPGSPTSSISRAT
jgi:predicted dienelactone hydrolase